MLTDWNGTAIAGLANAGRLLGEPAWIESAARAARFVLANLRPAGGPLLHVWRAGAARIPAFLSDYAYLVRGLLALERATGDAAWLRTAQDLVAEQQRRLGDLRGGYFAAAESSDLLFRTQEIFDGATPAPNAVAALNLLALADRTGEAPYRERAEALLRSFAPLVSTQLEAARAMMLVVRRLGGVGESAPAPGNVALDAEARSRVEARLSIEAGKSGDWERFHVRLRIEPDWHVQGNPAADEAMAPTALEGDGAELRAVEYPAAQQVADGAAGWQGDVEITGEFRRLVPRAKLRLRYQACNERRCLPPVEIELALR